MSVMIEKMRCAVDARGQVFEPLDAAGLAGQRNVHVVVTAPGQVRGNHFHTVGTEITSVIGPAQVRYREDGVLHDAEVPAGEVWKFTFPPGVVHAFRNNGPTTLLMVSFNTEPHDPSNPDTTRQIVL